MGKPVLFELMDDFSTIMNTVPIENAADQICNRAAAAPSLDAAIMALANHLVVENARRKHAEAKLASIQAASK